MSKIFGGKKPDYDRKRVVRETGKSSSVAPKPTPEKSEEEILYGEFSSLIDASNAVLPYLADAARAESIDVPSNMPELRAAVARKDRNNPNGDKISFDLFVKALAHFEELRNSFSQNSLGDLTGNASRDALAISERSAATSSGLKDSERDLWNSPWLARYTLWILLKQFAVNTILNQTAVKFPNGLEQPGYVADFVHSVGMGFVIDAANAEFAKLASEGNEAVTAFVESTPGGSVAGSSIELSELEQLAVNKVAENDFAKIMDYSMKEIAAVSDASLVSWLSYANARGIRNESVSVYRHSPQYTQPAPDGSGQKVKMSNSHRSALGLRAGSMRAALALNVQTSGLVFSADTLCCMVRIFGIKSTESLRSARELLRLAGKLRVNEYSLGVNQVSSDYTNFLNKASMAGLMALLDRVTDKVVDGALDTVDSDDEDYLLMSEFCPAFVDYSEIILDAAEYLAEMLLGMSVDMSSHPISAPPAKNPYSYTTGHIIHKKWIDTTIRLINEVINVIDNGNCDLDEHGRIPAERTQELVSSVYNSTNIGTARIPDEVIETHFPDMTEVSIPAPGGRHSYTVPKNGTVTSSLDERIAMRQVFERCGKKLSDEELDRILRDTNGAT